MPDPRRRLPEMIAGLALAVSVVAMSVLVSPLPALALLGFATGFLARLAAHGPDRNGP